MDVSLVPPKVQYRPSSYWTVEGRVDRLKELTAKNWSAGAIAHELGGGITRNAILGKLFRMGLSTGNTKDPYRPGKAAPRVSAEPRTRKPKDRPVRIKPTLKQMFDAAGPVAAERVFDKFMTFRQMQIGDNRCRFPVGDPREFDSFGYCGAKVYQDGEAYCAPCWRVMHAPPR